MNDVTLKNNLKAIKKVIPEMHDKILKAVPETWYTSILSKDKKKTPNLLINSGTHSTPLYPIDAPKKALYELVKHLPLSKTDITVLMGVGLGYLLRAAINHMKQGHHIVVIEPCHHLIKLVLSKYNLEKYLLNGEVILCTSEEEVGMVLHLLESKIPVENYNTLESGYINVIPDKYLKINNFTKNTLNQARCNTSTVMGNGFLMAENDIVNIPYVLRHRGVSELTDMYKGKPAVLVSTGPSLVKNIHLLKEAQDKCVIVSVGQALRILTGYDIKPDFICTVDFGEVNMDHFRGIMDSKVPLVAINRTFGKLLKSWMGPKFIVETPIGDYEKTSAGLLQGKGVLDQGGSVAHMCLAFARSLGCNPITFVGQDLALSDGKSHIAQVDSGGNVRVDENGMIVWNIKDPDSSVNKEGEKESITSMGPAIYKEGFFGKPVLTNYGLASFLTSFENLVNGYSDTKIMNSTCGGAMIKGAKRITLQDFIEEYCKDKIDKSIIKPLLSLDPNHMKIIEDAIPVIENDIKNLTKIRDHSKKGLEYNKLVMDNLKSKEKTVRRLVTKNHTHTIIAFKESHKHPLIMLALFNEERRIQGKDLNIKSDWKTLLRDRSKLEVSTKRNKLILEAAEKESTNILGKCEEVLALLKKYKETEDDSVLTTQEIEEITLEDSEDYFKVGNWTHPFIDARRVLGEAEEYFHPLRFKPSMSEFPEKLINRAREVKAKALRMRRKQIKDVEKEFPNDELKKMIKYIELVEGSKEEGKKAVGGDTKNEEEYAKGFDETLKMLHEAIELYPDKVEAKWGLATTLQFMYKFKESIKEYKKIIEESPDNIRMHFELAQVYVMKSLKEINEEDFTTGMDIFEKEVSEKTKQFDSFLLRISQILFGKEMYKESLTTIEKYLVQYPHNYEALVMKSKCLEELGKKKEAAKTMKEAEKIKPDIQKLLKGGKE